MVLLLIKIDTSGDYKEILSKLKKKEQLLNSPNSFNDYQAVVSDMPLYDDPALGLPGEVGEVLELIKKDRRPLDRRKLIDKEDLTKELGDVLWYMTRIATIYDISLSEIAETNIDKLTKRHGKDG